MGDFTSQVGILQGENNMDFDSKRKVSALTFLGRLQERRLTAEGLVYVITQVHNIRLKNICTL